jgi:LPS export ABC transporter protein LptC
MNQTATRHFFFAIGRFIRARAFGWGFVAILAAVAIFSGKLALETRPQTARKTKAAVAKNHLSDYEIQGVNIWRTSLDGSTQNHLSADSLVHYRDDLSSVLSKPLLIATSAVPVAASPATVLQHRTITNTIRADTAKLRNDGESIEFINAVNIERIVPAMLPSVLTTDSLTVLPDSNTVFSNSAVLLTQGKDTSLSQNGLSYFYTDAVLQLNGPVHAVLMPPQAIK